MVGRIAAAAGQTECVAQRRAQRRLARPTATLQHAQTATRCICSAPHNERSCTGAGNEPQHPAPGGAAAPRPHLHHARLGAIDAHACRHIGHDRASGATRSGGRAAGPRAWAGHAPASSVRHCTGCLSTALRATLLLFATTRWPAKLLLRKGVKVAACAMVAGATAVRFTKPPAVHRATMQLAGRLFCGAGRRPPPCAWMTLSLAASPGALGRRYLICSLQQFHLYARPAGTGTSALGLWAAVLWPASRQGSVMG